MIYDRIKRIILIVDYLREGCVALSNNNVRINDDPVQQYYLPTNKEQTIQRSYEQQFRQLLQQKINLATHLNRDLNRTNSSLLPASMLTNFLSVMSGLSPLPSNPFSEVNQLLPFSNQVMPNYVNNAVQSTSAKYNNLNSPSQFDEIIREAARKYHVDEKLIHAIIKMESNYNPRAKSHAGAVGLMQLMPQTAKYLGVKDRYDVRQNIFGGTKYISQMLRQFNGNLRLALAAYNAGPGNVKKYGGIPPFKETQNYVRKVMDYYLS